MAGDWIKMQKSLPRDPRVIRISSALKADRLRTVGGLLSAWCLFDEQTADGILDGYTPELMDEIIGFPGLSSAMESVGWLEVGDGFLVVPRFDEHNGQSAKRRAQDSARKTSARKADKCPLQKRTKSGLEKRREEKSNLPPSPQGGTKLKKSNPKITRVESNTETMARINGWFGRRPDTLWTISEADALGAINPNEAEIEGMEHFYLAQESENEPLHRRTALITLLNNWPSELDKARGYARRQRGAA